MKNSNKIENSDNGESYSYADDIDPGIAGYIMGIVLGLLIGGCLLLKGLCL